LRHPCAVVRSRLQLGWATDDDLASFLRQPALVEDHLADRMDLIRGTRSEAGKHALVWCISNLVPLRQFRAGGLPVVCYEHLRDRPEVEVPRMFAALGQPYDASVFDRLAVPSSTTRALAASGAMGASGRDGPGGLAPEQAADVLAVVEAFGLGHLYGAEPMPRVPAGAVVSA
jgi:hypothetical protein